MTTPIRFRNHQLICSTPLDQVTIHDGKTHFLSENGLNLIFLEYTCEYVILENAIKNLRFAKV